jgi:hypothetical protein
MNPDEAAILCSPVAGRHYRHLRHQLGPAVFWLHFGSTSEPFARVPIEEAPVPTFEDRVPVSGLLPSGRRLGS